MKLWNNLSKEQKRMAKIGIFNTMITAIIMVIIKPIVKGEAFSVTDILIEFAIFVVNLSAIFVCRCSNFYYLLFGYLHCSYSEPFGLFPIKTF